MHQQPNTQELQTKIYVSVKDCIKGLQELPDSSVNCIVTSPPYNKKGLAGSNTKITNQIWSKFNIDYSTYNDDLSEDQYQQWMIDFLNECYRVIKDDGSIFFNHKPRRHKNKAHLPTDFISKSNCNLYQLIIWNRKNSPNIRNDILVPCTEHVYWLTKKKPKTFRNNLDPKFRSEVWDITPSKQKNHPAPFTEQLVENCILLSTEENDLVVDPFVGSGTTALVCSRLNRDCIGFDIDSKYVNQFNNDMNS
jgi:modification methylase